MRRRRRTRRGKHCPSEGTEAPRDQKGSILAMGFDPDQLCQAMLLPSGTERQGCNPSGPLGYLLVPPGFLMPGLSDPAVTVV